MNPQQCITGNDFWVFLVFCLGVSVILDKILYPLINMTIKCFKKQPVTVITKELTLDQAIEELQKLKSENSLVTFTFAFNKVK